MKKVLVTGASGFIGKSLIARLINDGFEVVKMDSTNGDISSLEVWDNINFDHVSHVFHLAGKTYVPDSWENPYAFYKTNTLGTEVVLEFCRKHDISLTYTSAYIYGIPEYLPISEDAPIYPNNPYAHSKYMGEELCQFYASFYGLNISIIRPFNVFGTGQDDSFLIPSIIQQVLYHDSVVVNDLFPKRDYVYLCDLVDAIVVTRNSQQGCHIFNIGSGCSYSVKEVIDVVQKYAGTNKPVLSKKDVRPNEIPDVLADTSRAKKLLNWQCRVGFESGIEEMVAWERSK